MDNEDLFSMILVVSLVITIYLSIIIVPNLDGACPVEDKPCIISPSSVLYIAASEVLYFLEDAMGLSDDESTHNNRMT